MKEINFESSSAFLDWKADKEIFGMEYLGTLNGRKSQVCFEVNIENEETQLICINKSANELFFISKEEMNEWLINNQAKDIINQGFSDIYTGFNEFCCTLDDLVMVCFIDSTALI